jgi:acyl-CoA thioesterase FadM
VLLFFRVALIVLKGLFGRRVDVLHESVLRMRVWPTDMDLNFHLNDGRYLSLAGLGRIDLLARGGLLRPAMKRGWYPVVGAAMVRYRRELRWLERFTLHSRILGWDDKWFYFEHRFQKNDALAAVVYARGVLRTKTGAVPSRDVLALLGHIEASPPLPEVIERWKQANIP